MRKIVKINFSLIKNFGSLLLQQVSIYLISLLTFGIISRLLSPIEMGVYGLLVSVLYLIGLSANFGLKKVAIRLIAGYKAMNDDRYISVFWLSLAISTPMMFLIAFLTAEGLNVFGVFKTVNLNSLGFYLFLLLLFLFSFRNLISCGLEALQLFHIETIYVSGSFILYRFLMIYLLIKGFGILGVLIAWIIGESVAITLILKDVIPKFKPLRLKGENPGSMIEASIPIFISDLILLGVEYGDRIVSVIFGYSVLAFFYVAATGISFLMSVYQAIHGSMLPHLSEEFHKNGYDALSDRIKSISRYIFIFISPIFIVAAALAEPTIDLLVGPMYLEATPIFQIMCVGLWITSINPLLQSALIAANRTRTLMVIMLISILIDLAIMIFTYRYIGIIATGLGRFSLMISSYVLLLLYAFKEMHIDIDIEALVKSTISGFITGIIVWRLWLIAPDISLYPLYLLISVIIYLSLHRVLRTVNTDEIVSLYISLPNRERLKPLIKIICILSGVNYTTVMRKISEIKVI